MKYERRSISVAVFRYKEREPAQGVQLNGTKPRNKKNGHEGETNDELV
jgi:hypothetical protein